MFFTKPSAPQVATGFATIMLTASIVLSSSKMLQPEIIHKSCDVYIKDMMKYNSEFDTFSVCTCASVPYPMCAQHGENISFFFFFRRFDEFCLCKMYCSNQVQQVRDEV